MSNEQKLIDMMFTLAMVMREKHGMRHMTNEQLAEWIARNLSDCGFDTEPVGSSWGILKQ
jgi:hypothetical protein